MRACANACAYLRLHGPIASVPGRHSPRSRRLRAARGARGPLGNGRANALIHIACQHLSLGFSIEALRAGVCQRSRLLDARCGAHARCACCVCCVRRVSGSRTGCSTGKVAKAFARCELSASAGGGALPRPILSPPPLTDANPVADPDALARAPPLVGNAPRAARRRASGAEVVEREMQLSARMKGKTAPVQQPRQARPVGRTRMFGVLDWVEKRRACGRETRECMYTAKVSRRDEQRPQCSSPA